MALCNTSYCILIITQPGLFHIRKSGMVDSNVWHLWVCESQRASVGERTTGLFLLQKKNSQQFFLPSPFPWCSWLGLSGKKDHLPFAASQRLHGSISCQPCLSFSLQSAFTCRKYENSLMSYHLFWANTQHSHLKWLHPDAWCDMRLVRMKPAQSLYVCISA